MSQSYGRIRNTHVGSLIRTQPIVEFATQLRDGKEIDWAAYEKTVREEMGKIVDAQIEAGLDMISDGEFGKFGGWNRYVFQRLGGIELKQLAPGEVPPARAPGKDRIDFAEFYKQYEQRPGAPMRLPNTYPAVTGPITYIGEKALAADISRFQQATEGKGAPGREFFVCSVSPASIEPGIRDEFYHDEDKLLDAIADAMHIEYKAFIDAGFMVQIDDATMASHFDKIVPPGTIDDYRKWMKRRVDAINRAIGDLPQDRLRYHMCWGSWNGPHSTDVELKSVIDLLMQINVKYFALEMANPRHAHEWKLFETYKMPEGKVLIPGVISHSTNVLEHPELVQERLVRLGKLIGRDNIMAGTDCGFAFDSFMYRFHPQLQWAKLKSLVDGSALASKDLF